MWISANLNEIRESRGLRLFGAALAGLHLVSFFFWREPLLGRMSQPMDVICWPFFPDCGITRQVPFEIWRVLFALYGALAALTAFLFVRRFIGAAWSALALLTALKFIFQFTDYRGMGNYHYMMSLAGLGFLFLQDKIRGLRALIVLFYLASGILKFNAEWLSGIMLERAPAFMTPPLLQAAAVAVLALEMIVVWGLVARDARLRWASWFSFVAFHLLSWHWVGFYFPAIMLGLLLIYPLTWHERPPSGPLFLETWPRPLSARLFLLVFALLQIPPFFSRGEPALDARLRLFSFSMYDSRPLCELLFQLRYQGMNVEYAPVLHEQRRVQCNSLMFQSEMRRICAEEGRRPDFIRADAVLMSKLTGDSSYRAIIQERDFCAQGRK